MVDDVECGTCVVIGREVGDKTMAVCKVRIMLGSTLGREFAHRLVDDWTEW